MKKWVQGKKINSQHEKHLCFGGRDNEAVNSTFSSDGNMGFGQRRGRPSSWLRDAGREEGVENSMDIAQTSAWNKNIII